MRKLLAPALLIGGLSVVLARAPIAPVAPVAVERHAQLGDDAAQAPAGVLPQRTVRSHLTASSTRALCAAPPQLVAPSLAYRLGRTCHHVQLPTVTVRRHGARAPPVA